MGDMDRYDQQLRTQGRAVIGTRRWKVALLAVLGLGLALLFLPPIFLPDTSTAMRLVFALVVLACAAAGGVCAWRAVTGRPELVVDAEGIALGRRRAAWSQIDTFRVMHVRGATFATVIGRDGHAPLASNNPFLRELVRHGGSTLPNALEVRPTALVDWLNDLRRRWH